jgi:subtilisin family serine protease/peptidoglycan hydrolase-like protein with peptidoglycan-binding domain
MSAVKNVKSTASVSDATVQTNFKTGGNFEIPEVTSVPTSVAVVSPNSNQLNDINSDNDKISGNNQHKKEKVNKKNEILIKFKDTRKKEDTKKNLISKKPKLKLALRKSIKRINMEILELSDGEEIISTIAELKKDPNVEYVQPNYVLDTYLTPQDEKFREQWGLSNSGQIINGQTGTTGIDINAVNAWDITTGSNNTVVAVVDTGVDVNHPDLTGNMFVNEKELPNGLDDDGNGYVDDICGWDFANNDNGTFDSQMQDVHGTHVAGIIAAKLNNSGMTGVAPNIKILPLKFISGSTGYTSDAIDAIEYATSMGASIVNCSWGGSDYNQALKDAMSSSNAIFICAAGNSARNVDANFVYPACFDMPNIISVAAFDNNGEIAAFSNYGSKVHVAAPGVNILSTLPGNKYGFMSGTSMAAPFVSGTAALVKSFDSSIVASDVKSRILNNVTKVQNFTGKVSTSGRLDAQAALLNSIPSGDVILTPVPTPTASIEPKSKKSEPIYDTSLSGNNKTVKPIINSPNLFIDGTISSGIGKMSSDNGIENLSIYRLKENYITVTWTTRIKTDAELLYGYTKNVDQSCKINKLSTNHQITIKADNINDVYYYKVKSEAPDGRIFETDVRNLCNDITDLGGNAPSIDETKEGTNSQTAQEVSVMSYISDNGTNHSFETAQQISTGTVFGTIEQYVGSDYYAVSVESGKTYSFDLVGLASGEDYDLNLYDNSMTMKSFSVNNSNYDENITYTASYTGKCYIVVVPHTVSDTSSHHNYQLMLYTNDKTPDNYEPNDSMGTAISFINNSTIYPTLNINTDEDWFVLDTAKKGKLTITMKSIPSGCDYDMTVYDSTGAYIGASAANGSNDEKFASLINTTGKYYIRVYSYSGSSASDTYELRAGVNTPDSYEVNDSIYDVMYSGLPSVSVGSCISATIDNIDDVDCYRFTVDSSTKVGIRLQNIPAGTDYDLALYSYSGDFVELDYSDNGGSFEETIIKKLASGTYFIKVNSYSGSLDMQNYILSVTDDNAGIVKVEFDKTSALEGEIITAILKVERISCFAGYQVNLKYDPEVIAPIDNNLHLYASGTKPQSGDILINNDFSPISSASNDLQNGILNFSSCYIDLNAYRQDGNIESSGIIAKIKFKVLKNRQIQLKFENSTSMPNSISGVCLYNTYGCTNGSGFIVQQPPVLNEGFAINTQSSIQSVSSLNDENTEVILFSGTGKVSGYIAPDLSSTNLFECARQGFKVAIKENSFYYSVTDKNGYFEISDIPSGMGYTIEIKKDNYLRREIRNVAIYSDVVIGKSTDPLLIYPGDITINGTQDDAINLQDVMNLATAFNSKVGDSTYKSDYDINNDNVVNIADIMAVIKNYNKSTSNYPGIDALVPSTPEDLKIISETYNTSTICWASSDDNIGVRGYNIYIDNSLVGSTNGELTYEVKNLEPFKSYNVTVQSVDAMGNASPLSTPINLFITSIPTGVYNTNLQLAQHYLNILKDKFPNIDLGSEGVSGYWSNWTSDSILVFQQWCYNKWDENLSNYEYMSQHWYLEDITPNGKLDYRTFEALRIEASRISFDYSISAPIDVSLSSNVNDITISWNKVEGAIKYVVLIDGNQQVEVEDTKYVHGSLQTGEEHTYRVMATDGVQYSAWSSAAQSSTYKPNSKAQDAFEDKLDELVMAGKIDVDWVFLADAYLAMYYAEQLYPNTSENPNSLHNGDGDAFRHIYWNYTMTHRSSAEISTILANAYEDGEPYAPTIERDMDLYNGEIGCRINYIPEWNEDLFKSAVQNVISQNKHAKIVNGKLVIGSFTGVDVLKYLQNIYLSKVKQENETGKYSIRGVQLQISNTRKIGRAIYASENDIMAAIKAMGNLSISNMLKFGMSSSEVAELQKRLVLLGLDIGNTTPDTDFGEKTLSAVIAIQYKTAIGVNGKVESGMSETVNKINYLLKSGITASQINIFNSTQRSLLSGKNITLRLNSKGDGVRYLQAILKGYFGLDVGPAGVDGDFGNCTLTAVEALQYGLGYQFVTSEVTPKDWEYIYDFMKNVSPQMLNMLSDWQLNGIPSQGNNDTIPPTWQSDSFLKVMLDTGTEVTLAWSCANDNDCVKEYVIYKDDIAIATVAGYTNTYKISFSLSDPLYNVFRVEAKDFSGLQSTTGPRIGVVRGLLERIYDDFLSVEEEVFLSYDEKVRLTQLRKYYYESYQQTVGTFSWIDIIQFGLDILGLVPVVGEAADGINACIYLVRGDKLNASLSASSMLPITGCVSTGGKLVNKTTKFVAHVAGDAAELGAKATRYSPETYYTYRELYSLINKSGLKGRGIGLEAHHLLEKQFASIFGVAQNDIISVALTPTWHRNVKRMGKNLDNLITTELKTILTNSGKTTAGVQEIWKAHRNVYESIGQPDWAMAIYEQYVKKFGVSYN